ncbi:MAG TPA: hypothetical protein VJ650_14120 [Gemmatimonadaceae bacterium]|nr:hypothetical protein [Gemmatimonadaceae bacterium]
MTPTRFLARVSGAAAWRGRFCIPLCGALLAASADAQARRVTGHVLRPAADSMRGVQGTWVVLHRVAADHSGPLDSVRTARDGRFTLRYTPSGAEEAIYFVSATHDGIAYFSPPLDTAHAVEETELAVFDTTSAPVPIHVRGHHIVVRARDSVGRREVVEVFELANDSTVTRVAAGDVPVWSTALPDGATDVRIGQGDLSEDAIRTDSGRVRVYAPLAPGIKQLSYAYRIDARGFPLARPVEGRGALLEVLLEEPNAVATAPGLARVDPVTVDSLTFNRFLAQETPQGSVVRIEIPRAAMMSRRGLIVALVTVIAVVMALLLVRFFRRLPQRSSSPSPASRAAEQLAREIAALDARMESAQQPSDADRADYARRRAELRNALANALDAERRQA